MEYFNYIVVLIWSATASDNWFTTRDTVHKLIKSKDRSQESWSFIDGKAMALPTPQRPVKNFYSPGEGSSDASNQGRGGGGTR